MNIMFEDSITDDIRSRYMLLPLDTFYFENTKKISTAYCLIENTPMQEMFSVDKYIDLHKNLIKNYYLKNWNYCEQVIEHLLGRWNGDIDTFYKSILDRISQHKVQGLSEGWTGFISRGL